MIVSVVLQENIREYVWIVPYVFAGFSIFIIYLLFRLFEHWYTNTYDTLIYRQLFVFRTLSRKQKKVLEEEFHFYSLLTPKQQRHFEHRIAYFIKTKNFVGREEHAVTERMKVLVAAVGCMLTFGRKDYSYRLLEHILIYPEDFYSTVNETYHKGEFNPGQRTLVLSWKDFESGYRITDDNLNLGIHEFMHALQLESKGSNDIDALRFERQYKNILGRLADKNLKDRLDAVKYFRAYAFTNQFEFMAVLAEYFIESPKDFKTKFPELYGYMKTLLNFNFAGY